MDKQGIIDYVMESPSNTNPAILGQMIDEVGGGGSESGSEGLKIFTVDETRVSSDMGYTDTLNKTWQEIDDVKDEYDLLVVKLHDNTGYAPITNVDVDNYGGGTRYKINIPGEIYTTYMSNDYPSYSYIDK